MYTILVVDDEKDIVSALEIYLKAEGYRVLSAGNLAHDFRPGFINLHQALGRAAGLNGAAGPEPDSGGRNVHQKRKALFVHVQLFHQRFNHIGAVVWTPGSLGNHLQSGIFNFFHFQILLLFVFQPYAGAKLIWLCFILLAKSGIE